jgi:hypothetical protein
LTHFRVELAPSAIEQAAVVEAWWRSNRPSVNGSSASVAPGTQPAERHRH